MYELVIKLLRWSEKYTKTDMVYLAQGGAWLGLSQAVSALQAFLVLIILANLVTPEILGEYRFAIVALSILGVLSLPGMQEAMMESVPKGYLGNLASGFFAKARYGLLGSLSALGGSIYYGLQGNISLSIIFAFFTIAAPLFDTSTLYTFYLYAQKRFKQAAVFSIQVRLVTLIAVVIAIFLFPTSTPIIIIALIGVPIIVNLLFTRRVYTSTDPNLLERVDSKLVPYARHLSVMSAFLVLAMYLDSIFVWHFLGESQLAIFFIAMAIPQELLRVANLLPILAYPKFSVTDVPVIQKTLPKKMWSSLLVVIVLVIFYILLAPFIFSLVFPEYVSAVIYTQVLALTLLQAPFLLIRTFFNTIKAVKILYIFGVVFPFIRIGLSLLLIIPFGIWGVVIAILFEATVRTVFSIVAFHLYKPNPTSNVEA